MLYTINIRYYKIYVHWFKFQKVNFLLAVKIWTFLNMTWDNYVPVLLLNKMIERV